MSKILKQVVTLRKPRRWDDKEGESRPQKFEVAFRLRNKKHSEKRAKESRGVKYRCSNDFCLSAKVAYERVVKIVHLKQAGSRTPLRSNHWAIGGLRRTVTRQHYHGSLFCKECKNE